MNKKTTHFFLTCLAIQLICKQQTHAEGTKELGLKQALQASTELHVDLIDNENESLLWTGIGSLEVYGTSGQLLSTLSSGQSHRFNNYAQSSATLRIRSNQAVDSIWDISILKNNVAQKGRIHSNNWYFNAASFASTHAIEGSFYALVPGGKNGSDAIIELKLDGLAGYVYQINANTIGVNGANGGKSVPRSGHTTTPEFPIYLSPPQVAKHGRSTPIVSALSFIGGTTTTVSGASKPPCQDILPGQSTGEFVFESNVEGSYHLICDLNHDGTFDRTSGKDLLLIGESRIGKNTASWDGTLNTIPIEPGAYQCKVQLNVGEFHYVGLDIETSFQGMRLFEVGANDSRSPLTMFFDDSLVMNNAVNMPNGEVGLVSSGEDGLYSGNYSENAIANTNARAWGQFAGNGRGNNAFIDTYTWLDSSTSASLNFNAVTEADGDGDGLSDFDENCVIGSDPADSDTDDDGVTDGEQYGQSSSVNDGGLESNGRLSTSIATRQYLRKTIQAITSDELGNHMPKEGPRKSRARAATPSDLVNFTNGVHIEGADYIDENGHILGGILLIETRGETYEHSKAICDRVHGAELLSVYTKEFDTSNYIGARFINQENNTIDHSLNFKMYFDQSNQSATIEKGWLDADYPTPSDNQTIWNIQIWSRFPGDESRIFQSFKTHNEATFKIEENTKRVMAPDAFFQKGEALGNQLNLSSRVQNDHSSLKAVAWTVNDIDWSVERHEFDLPTTNTNHHLVLPLFKEATVDILADGKLVDQMWLADGAWATIGEASTGIDCNGPLANISNHPNALPLHGCLSIQPHDRTSKALRHFLKPIKNTSWGSMSFYVESDNDFEVCIDQTNDRSVCSTLAGKTTGADYQISLAAIQSIGSIHFNIPQDTTFVAGKMQFDPMPISETTARSKGCSSSTGGQGRLAIVLLCLILCSGRRFQRHRRV